MAVSMFWPWAHTIEKERGKEVMDGDRVVTAMSFLVVTTMSFPPDPT
jgi:hypothetical protein